MVAPFCVFIILWCILGIVKRVCIQYSCKSVRTDRPRFEYVSRDHCSVRTHELVHRRILLLGSEICSPYDPSLHHLYAAPTFLTRYETNRSDTGSTTAIITGAEIRKQPRTHEESGAALLPSPSRVATADEMTLLNRRNQADYTTSCACVRARTLHHGWGWQAALALARRDGAESRIPVPGGQGNAWIDGPCINK
jgi:hypothetical protein